MNIVGISGFGYSGSGAVLDLLKEYSTIIDICDNYEFVFPYIPDGLEDLTYNIMNNCSRFQSSDIAILRFKKLIYALGRTGWNEKTNNELTKITEDFLDSIIQVDWKGYWMFDELNTYGNILHYAIFRIRRKLNSVFKSKIVNFHSLSVRDMALSIRPDNYEFNVTKFLEKIILSCINNQYNGEMIVLNQPFPANNPNLFFKYFTGAKAIIVYRDPRDTYLNLIKVNNDALWFPYKDVQKFITYYKILLESYDMMNNDNSVCLVKFEDLIYNYDKTIDDIELYLNIKGKHIFKKKFFDPNISIKNTQLYRFYNKNNREVKIIEKQLGKYLYPFNETLDIKHDSLF